MVDVGILMESLILQMLLNEIYDIGTYLDHNFKLTERLLELSNIINWFVVDNNYVFTDRWFLLSYYKNLAMPVWNTNL